MESPGCRSHRVATRLLQKNESASASSPVNSSCTKATVSSRLATPSATAKVSASMAAPRTNRSTSRSTTSARILSSDSPLVRWSRVGRVSVIMSPQSSSNCSPGTVKARMIAWCAAVSLK